MIAIYARQSVDKKDSLSIETQTEYCAKYCDGKPYQCYEDKGYSGKNTARPALQKLLYDIEHGTIKNVIVYKLDRISRNITDFYNLYQIMKDNSCQFLSASEKFDTSTSMGTAMMGIIAVFAQMERETIQKRVKDNYYYRLETDGRWPGGPAPYGFRIGRIKDTDIPTLVINKDEIGAVRYCFDHYEDELGISLGKLGAKLTEKGYVGRKRKSFDNVTIARMLQNPVYAIADETLYKYFKAKKAKLPNPCEEWDGTRSAIIVGKRVNNANTRKYTDFSEQTVFLTNFKGIIPSAKYIRVQNRLAQNQQIRRANAPTRMMELAGLLKCAKCGYAIKFYNKSRLDCYRNKSLHECNAEFKEIDFEDVRASVAAEVQKTLDGLSVHIEKAQEGKKRIERQIADLTEKRNRAAKRVIEQDDEKLARAMESALLDIQTELEQKELELSTYTPIVYEPIGLFGWTPEIRYLSLEELKAIYRKLIKRVLLSENGEITIEWKI